MANSTDSKVVAVPLEGDELNGTNPYKDLIPSRIHCNVLLQVRDSPITGAGRAVFALQDVKIGEVIFRIPNPLVAVVSQNPLVRGGENNRDIKTA